VYCNVLSDGLIIREGYGMPAFRYVHVAKKVEVGWNFGVGRDRDGSGNGNGPGRDGASGLIRWYRPKTITKLVRFGRLAFVAAVVSPEWNRINFDSRQYLDKAWALSLE
jgi:hypothetical protein